MSAHEEPGPGGPDAEEFSALLVGIQRLIRRQLRAGLEQPRLRGAQVERLRLVVDSPGLRVSDAAAELFLAGNSVSTLVNQLVGQGLLRRETDPADRRAALLYATEEAVERLAAWRARRTALVGEVAAARARRERLARENTEDILHREDRRWDWFLGKSCGVLNPCSLLVSGPSASGPSPNEGVPFAFRFPWGSEIQEIGSIMGGD